MKFAVLAFVLVVLAGYSFGRDCVSGAEIRKPELTDAARKSYEAKLAEAKAETERNPKSADALIWLGRRTAYLGDYREAIRIFGDGARRFPRDARFLRHRGHRLITVRCFGDAVRDLEKAAGLVRGKPDETEPDGLPNARNTPTSTLQSNIYYHLGLAHYLRGDFRKALAAYRECEKVSKNPDMLVATKYWLYLTLRQLWDAEAAEAALADVGDGLDIIENGDYYRLIRVFQGRIKDSDVYAELSGGANTLGNASLGYGLGMWCLAGGDPPGAASIFRRIVAGNQWASFGYIAAEVELKRMK